jgi:dephospho-CoA kinase
MPRVVALSGHSGAGKSTAARRLAEISGGEAIYLGQAVLDDIKARGVDDTPDEERSARVRLREEHGDDYLVLLSQGRIEDSLAVRDVFIDSIFAPLELERLEQIAGPVTLLQIEATFAQRVERLRIRDERGCDAEALKQRDDLEVGKLGILKVFGSASHRIQNQASLDEFRSAISAWWARLP